MNKTIISLLSEAANKYPDFNYLNEKTDNGWIATSFKQTDELSDTLATALLDLGFQPQQKIAILSEGRTYWVIAQMAIAKIQAISVPLSVKLLPNEILFRLTHSESIAIFTSKNNLHKILQILPQLPKNFKIIYFDSEQSLNSFSIDKNNILLFSNLLKIGAKKFLTYQSKLQQLKSTISSEQILTITYTSGTTGDPKGIMLTHKNYWHNTLQAYLHFKNDIPAFGKGLVILPIDHSFAQTAAIFTAMRFPIALYFLDARGGPFQALKNIPINLQEVQPDYILSVPALSYNFMTKIIEQINKTNPIVKNLFYLGLNAGIKKLYTKSKLAKILLSVPHKIADKLIFKRIRQKFGNYKLAIGGGALLDIKQQEFFYSIGMPIYQGYGLTEASPIISANKPSDFKLGTSGKPMPLMEIKIIKNNKETATGEIGEIIVKGDNVMKGYFKNPEATAKTIKNGWLYTGDLGYFDKDGFLVVTGREKALLISQDGEKYSPEEIEQTISATSQYIYQIMLYNDHKPFTSAIITLNENAIKTAIEKFNLSSAEQLLNLIEQSLTEFQKDKKLKNKFPSRWLPKKFIIAPEPFTEQNKMLNSTLKLVRRNVIATYKFLIDKLYTQPEAVNNHNLQVLSKFFGR